MTYLCSRLVYFWCCTVLSESCKFLITVVIAPVFSAYIEIRYLAKLLTVVSHSFSLACVSVFSHAGSVSNEHRLAKTQEFQ